MPPAGVAPVPQMPRRPGTAGAVVGAAPGLAATRLVSFSYADSRSTAFS